MKKINLALQGGGAHGAFTWGVLDALLSEPKLEIEAISCASAGAMNACALVSGWMQNPKHPREGAKASLAAFWRSISMLPSLSNLNMPNTFGIPNHFGLNQNPWFVWMDLMSRVLSPYQTNPFNYNPLRQVLNQSVSIDALNACKSIQLFVCATNVKTGRVTVFSNRQGTDNQHPYRKLSLDAILASACLPFSFHAVNVDGEYYWDGGYMGNPSLFTLYDNTVPDMLLVQINPLVRDDVPDTAPEIIDRVNEISFNSSLMLEMRAIEFVQKLLNQERVDSTRYKRILMHAIAGGEFLAKFGASSKSNTNWEFLTTLHDLGFNAGKVWLESHFDDIGQKSSVDIRKMFL